MIVLNPAADLLELVRGNGRARKGLLVLSHDGLACEVFDSETVGRLPIAGRGGRSQKQAPPMFGLTPAGPNVET